MGLFDFLIGLFSRGERIQCPSCGTDGARRTRDGLVHCKNPSCPYFDMGVAYGGAMQRRLSSVPTRGDFRPQHPVSIRYRNYVGQERDFSAELGSIVRKNNHLVAEVAPTGRKITLSRERIQNLAQVEDAMPTRVASNQPWPTPRERQILGYHKKNGTTSPRYEKLRAKHPNW
jgi:ribosomal protein L37AE/L43A